MTTPTRQDRLATITLVRIEVALKDTSRNPQRDAPGARLQAGKICYDGASVSHQVLDLGRDFRLEGALEPPFSAVAVSEDAFFRFSLASHNRSLTSMSSALSARKR